MALLKDIKKLNVNKSEGPDDIHPRFLSENLDHIPNHFHQVNCH